jgi:predicted DNA-binding transcriptional regulator AlpA
MSDEEERLISKAECRLIVGISYAEMARREKAGKFPRRIADGPYRNSRRFYLLSEVRAYVRDKVAAYGDRKSVIVAGSVLLPFCIAFSLASAFGFAASVRDRGTSDQAALAANYKTTVAQLKDAESAPKPEAKH